MASRALTALRLGNFKAFADEQYIPIRPLTLIYGPNSAGKSSVIHSLLLAHQAIETGNLDVYRTNIGGEAVDLGGFGRYVYRRDRSNSVEWAVDINPKQIDHESNFLNEFNRLTAKITIRSTANQQVRVDSFTIAVDGSELLYMSARPDNRLQLERLDSVQLWKLNKNREPSLEERAKIEVSSEELVLRFSAGINQFLPKIDDLDNAKGIYWQESDPSIAILHSNLNNLIDTIRFSVQEEIYRLRYLGPLRSYPPRHFGFSRDRDANWEAGGGSAWDKLLNDADVRQKVNIWLGDEKFMQTPYELQVRNLLPTSQLAEELEKRMTASFYNLTTELLLRLAQGGETQQQMQVLAQDLLTEMMGGNANSSLPEIEELVANLVDSKLLSKSWSDQLISTSSERFSELVLFDKRTETPVSHRDVGIGISQVLPVFVSCYALSDSLIAIEQPELHLHPALQAELGDAFIESALGENQNTFILESHSEYLLLRIMRRMRETFNDELPEGLPPVRPEDVSVLYVQPIGQRSVVREMPLNERGDLLNSWPGGFFEEGLREVLA